MVCCKSSHAFGACLQAVDLLMGWCAANRAMRFGPCLRRKVDFFSIWVLGESIAAGDLCFHLVLQPLNSVGFL
jgi:Na+/glutamate symporter